MTAELLVKLTIINCHFSSLRLRFVTAELLVKLTIINCRFSSLRLRFVTAELLVIFVTTRYVVILIV